MKNDELLNYIRQQLQLGINKKEIKNTLLSQGQQEYDVEMAFKEIKVPSKLHKISTLWKVIFVTIAVVVGLVSVFVGMNINSSLNPSARDIPPINDSDLSLKTISIPNSDNSYFDLLKLSKVIYYPKGKGSLILNMISGKTWDKELAEELISKNTQAFNYFISALKKPVFQDPAAASAVNISPDTILPPLSSLRQMAFLSVVKAFYLEKQGKDKEALNEALIPIIIGQKIENSQLYIIEYLAATTMKEVGLEAMQKIVSSSTLSSNELLPYVRILNKLYGSNNGLVSALKINYRLTSIGVDRSAESGGKADNSFVPAVNEKMLKNRYYFQPNVTKSLFAESIRKEIRVVSGPCGSVLKIKPVVFDVWDSSNKLKKTENVIGKLIYNTFFTSLSNLIKYKCDGNLLVGATQAMVAVRAFYNDTGKYPTTLEELKPKYLSSVPKDPYDGRQIKYSKNKKIIYSVGRDGRDEGGSTGDNWKRMQNPTFKIYF